uniref:Uncharacterized protein n=1 Tax=Coccidioides posadasii RMSCC 3488 TaxID=454284 RepID=A0A0J6FSU9_COCPO|nr:hypothetical protein CPAG_08784 [Coccidioides posadasii RMSCC 3488]
MNTELLLPLFPDLGDTVGGDYVLYWGSAGDARDGGLLVDDMTAFSEPCWEKRIDLETPGEIPSPGRLALRQEDSGADEGDRGAGRVQSRRPTASLARSHLLGAEDGLPCGQQLMPANQAGGDRGRQNTRPGHHASGVCRSVR